MVTKTLSITGMHCASCEKLISMDLAEIGVQAQLDAKTGKAEVSFDPGKVDEERIIEKVHESGYQATFI